MNLNDRKSKIFPMSILLNIFVEIKLNKIYSYYLLSLYWIIPDLSNFYPSTIGPSQVSLF